MINYELHVDSLQDFCIDEIKPYLNRVSLALWGWATETVANRYGDYNKRIHGIWFTSSDDATLFALKYANLIK